MYLQKSVTIIFSHILQVSILDFFPQDPQPALHNIQLVLRSISSLSIKNVIDSSSPDYGDRWTAIAYD